MPIRGLSTREDVRPSFPNIGKLRKGGPKQQNGQFGPDLDHFRFTSDDPDIVAAFTAAYGEKPATLPVVLLDETVENCFSSWREEYGRNQLCKRRCDGQFWTKWVDGSTVYTGEHECDFPFRDTDRHCPDCPATYVGRLEVILRELWEAGFIGLVTMETHSINDIGTISGVLVQNEPLGGKEFLLKRVERRIGAPNKKTGKRIAVNKWLVSLELTRDWVLRELDAAKYRRIAELNGLPPAALPAMIETTVEDAEFATAVVEGTETTEETEAPDETSKQESKKKPSPPARTNGKRPYTAKAVRESIEDLIEGDDGTPISDLQVGLVAGKLEECFAGDKDAKLKRHSVPLHLFNKESCKDLTRAEASAILKWVLATQEKDSTGDYPLHLCAPAEAAAIVKASLIVAGQPQMDL